MKDLQILSTDTWPLEYTPGFGEKEIRNLLTVCFTRDSHS